MGAFCPNQLSALGIWSMSWCRTSEGFTLQVVSYADVLITLVLEFSSYYLFCLCDASCGWPRTNKRIERSRRSGLKPIRAHLWAGGVGFVPAICCWSRVKSLRTLIGTGAEDEEHKKSSQRHSQQPYTCDPWLSSPTSNSPQRKWRKHVTLKTTECEEPQAMGNWGKEWKLQRQKV